MHMFYYYDSHYTSKLEYYQEGNYSAMAKIKRGKEAFSSSSQLLDSGGKQDQGSKAALSGKTSRITLILDNKALLSSVQVLLVGFRMLHNSVNM